MLQEEWIYALAGGVLIGLSVSLMLLWSGRTTGISSIIYGLVRPMKGDISWRLSFLFGLIAGGLTLKALNPDFFPGGLATNDWTVIIAGVLVGFGTVLGSGCTSGHGVCGISRLSPRSLMATALFICAGVATVAIFKAAGVLS